MVNPLQVPKLHEVKVESGGGKTARLSESRIGNERQYCFSDI